MASIQKPICDMRGFFLPQVDSANAGRVLASDAAVFLKKSGLTDLVLGKVFNGNYLIYLIILSSCFS